VRGAHGAHAGGHPSAGAAISAGTQAQAAGLSGGWTKTGSGAGPCRAGRRRRDGGGRPGPVL